MSWMPAFAGMTGKTPRLLTYITLNNCNQASIYNLRRQKTDDRRRKLPILDLARRFLGGFGLVGFSPRNPSGAEVPSGPEAATRIPQQLFYYELSALSYELVLI
jgi:hypothetical protein